MALMVVGAEKKPTLLCTGYLGSFDKLGRSSKEDSDYCWLPFKVKGIGGSRDASGKLFFAPEFFERDITPKTFNTRYGKEIGAKRLFVYRKNIAAKDQLGTLQALCGTVENFGKLDEFLGETLGPTPDEEQIAAALQEFFNELGPQPFGFILKQRKTWDGHSYRMDEATGDYILTKKGQKIKEYTREAYYDIDSFFSLTKSRLKSLVSMVEKNNANVADPEWSEKYPEVEEMKFTFDLEEYEVSPPAEPEQVEVA